MPMAEATDPRSPDLEAKLRALDAANELAYRYAYRENSRHCRHDPAWNRRIAELEAQLDVDGLARAFALALELSRTLTGKP
jgi:hypothetical protein